MQFPSTTTTTLLTILWYYALSSNAATCDSGSIFVCVEAGGGFAQTDAMLNARQNYCGGDRWQTHGCYEEPATDGGSTVLIENSKPGANDRQTCWDALESILNDCTQVGTVNNWPAGSYEAANGQTYTFSGCSAYRPCKPRD